MAHPSSMTAQSSGGLPQAFREMGVNINATIDQGRAQLQAQARRIQELVAQIEQEKNATRLQEQQYIRTKQEIEAKIDQDLATAGLLQNRCQTVWQQVGSAEQGYDQVMSSFRSHTHPGATVQKLNP